MTFRAALAFTFLCAATVPASSEVDVAGLAQEAARQLGEAAEALSEAEKAPDRIEALTRTIRAYEAGLSAMREGLRRAALDERALAERLTDQDEAIGELLVLLERVSKAGQVEAALHPGSAPDTVRAGILAASMVPALEERDAHGVHQTEGLALLLLFALCLGHLLSQRQAARKLGKPLSFVAELLAIRRIPADLLAREGVGHQTARLDLDTPDFFEDFAGKHRSRES